MRVAIVTESFLPIVNGVSNSVCRVAEQLRAAGHEAIIIAPQPGRFSTREGIASANAQAESSANSYAGFPVYRVAAVNVPRINSLPIGVPTPRIYALLRKFRPDVVHVASPFVVGGAGIFAAKALGVPCVAVYQTDVPGFAHRYGLRHLEKMSWRWVRAMHNNCALTLAPSSETIAQLERQGVRRVHYWGRGVDTQRFHPSRRSAELRAQWLASGGGGGTAPDGVVGRPSSAELAPHAGQRALVGFVGRLAAEKAVERLAAVYDMPQVQLVIVGDGPERRRLEERLPHAVFTGALYGQELATAFASLDVFIHPGEYETFCQAIQEAQASGLPVIAPRAGGPVDLVTPGMNGYLLGVESFEAELPAALQQLVAAEAVARRGEMSRAARAAVEQKTWPRICQQLIGYYRDAIGI